MFQGLPEINGFHICNFALGVHVTPYNPIVEYDVAMHIFRTAETAQKMATGLGRIDFRNFHELALDFERSYYKLQTILVYAGQIVVRSDGSEYRYAIIIPDEPDLNSGSIRPKLTEDEFVKVRLHRINIANLFQQMAFADTVEKFQLYLLDLKFELMTLHSLDLKARLR